MDQNSFAVSIKRTLAFFDLFDYPLTKEELYRYSWQSNPNHLNIFLENLERLNWPNKFGLYFLPGREEIIEKRRARIPDLEKKLKIANRGAKIIRFVPFVRAIFLCNNTAFGTSTENSDIDVLIVVKSKRIWIARLLTTVLLSFFNLRRTKRNIKNKICLSFYLSDTHLNLQKIAIKDPDIYLVYWIAQLWPLYDPNNLYHSIFSANQWIKSYLQNYSVEDFEPKIKDGKISRAIKRMFEISWKGAYGDLVENQAREAQKTKMKMNLYSRQNDADTAVIINDDMLKFHENDRREFYQQSWQKKLIQL